MADGTEVRLPCPLCPDSGGTCTESRLPCRIERSFPSMGLCLISPHSWLLHSQFSFLTPLLGFLQEHFFNHFPPDLQRTQPKTSKHHLFTLVFWGDVSLGIKGRDIVSESYSFSPAQPQGWVAVAVGVPMGYPGQLKSYT